MERRTFLGLMGATMATAGTTRLGRAAAATNLKVGTLFPMSSEWGKALQLWEAHVTSKSSGAVKLTFDSTTWTDEDALVEALRKGQVEGAVLHARSAGKLFPSLAALELPLYRKWTSLDKAREALGAELEAAAFNSNLSIAGYFDIGSMRWLSRDAAILQPEDLKTRKVAKFRWDLLANKLDTALGINGLEIPWSTVLTHLGAKTLDVLHVPIVLAEALTWTSQLTHANEHVSGLSNGVAVFSRIRFDLVPPVHKGLIVDGARATFTNTLNPRIRAADDAALDRFKKAKKVDVATDLTKWLDAYARARKLASPMIPAALITKLESFA